MSIFLVLLSIPAFAFSDTLHVPGDYTTIQGAIDASANGDIVLVAPGRYEENIDFLGKAIAVKSSGGACVTVIDANDYGSVVTFTSGEGPDSLLEGFTLTEGRGTYIWPQIYLGGGIYCDLSSPTISCNIIVGNRAYNMGGGLYCRSGSPLVINNTIADNSADIDGGGLYYYGGSPRTINNTVTRNTVLFGGGGGLCCRSSDCVVTNTIFWENTAASGPEISLTYPAVPSTLTISYSDVEGGQGAVHVDSGSTLVWGAGMIDSDPLFVDSSNGDYHIIFNSPCRGSGDNSFVTGSVDFEGDPRIHQGTVDMGADEFYTHLYVTGDKIPGGTIQGKFIGLPGTAPVGLFLSTGTISPPMSTVWGEFWLQGPWILLGPLGAIPSDGVMVLPTTLPGSIPAPYDVPMQALIGLHANSLSNLYVIEVR